MVIPATTRTAAALSAGTGSLTTRVLSALGTRLEFGSMEDGGFTASGDSTEWIDATRKELRGGGCVALPTETVYGLAANALDAGAVRAIFGAKERPADNPLIVHVSSIRMLRTLYHLEPAQTVHGTDNAALESAGALATAAMQRRLDDAERSSGRRWPEIPHVYHAAIRRFWPGPLTIVLPRPPCIPIEVLGGHGTTVAFRFPAHPVARAAIDASGVPVAAPSANASGRPSPTLARHVTHDLAGRIALVVDGGPCAVGVESTVVDGYSPNAFVSAAADAAPTLSPCVLRPGGVSVEALQALGGAWQRVRVYRRDFASAEIEANPTTPGMKYRHYSPAAPVHVVRAGDRQALRTMQTVDRLAQTHAAVGVVLVGDDCVRVHGEQALSSCRVVVRRVADARGLAHSLFALLRDLDESDRVEAIVVQGVGDAGDGLAVMNRLDKAASFHA
ncbi:hypothetical protein H4217_003742 [Coemansia sp. RSA 1939]|nr:hypothetical protein H4217_003742 [Coemansia sp. RSA 1939]KAJ2604551.1 hypothetical protein EV177_006374 [Coemansia sp. RSA 1804]KAJ2687736.1 hypothetical protein GGH99_003199 [Coemansia sp. RSA 1285]